MSGLEPLTLAQFEALAIDAHARGVSADPRGATRALEALGDECERLAAADPARAIATGELLARTARSLSERSAVARALRATIPALAYSGKLEAALTRAVDAQVAATLADDPVEHARAKVASLHSLAKLGRTDEAIAVGCAARDALLVAQRADLAARAELNLANIYKIRGEHALSLACLQRALGGVPSSDRAARGTIENTLGETYLQVDEFDQARAAFDRAQECFEAVPLARAIVLGNKADLLARCGRLGDALREFEGAAHLVREIAPGHHARLLLECAEVLAALGAHREALESADSALVEATSLGLKAELMRGSLVRARALAAVARREEAAAATARALSLAQELRDSRGSRAAALVGSELALSSGDAARATQLADLALEGASPLDEARATLCAARARLMTDQAEQGLALASQSAATAKHLAVLDVHVDALLACADCERALQHSDRAIAHLTQAMSLAEEMRCAIAADSHRTAFSAARLRVYEDLALDLLAQPTPERLAQAFAAVERARSRVLLDVMLRAIDRSEHSDATSVSDELLALRAKLSTLHTVIARDADRPGERRGIAPPTLESMRSIEHEIDGLLTAEQTRRGASSLFATPIDSVDALRALAADDVLITYFTAGEELMAFVGMGEKLTCVRAIANITDVEPLVEKLLFQLRSGLRAEKNAPSTRSLTALSRVLFDILIAPILNAQPSARDAKRLVIVPHGVLHALPFAALHDGSSWLIERFELHVAPSASIACGKRRAQGSSFARSLVVGVADDVAPLINEEVAAVARALNADVIANEAATRAAVRAAVKDARILHFACHGRFVPSLPHASGLQLADGWVSIRDLVDFDLNAELVFVSGCETGCHAIDAGEELCGIARAMLAAGAARLVTTLWSVRDAAAVDVSVHFHQAILQGIRPSAALREAMVASMRVSPHPSWWAPFVVIGAL